MWIRRQLFPASAWYAGCMEERAAQFGAEDRNDSDGFGSDRKASETDGTVSQGSIEPESPNSISERSSVSPKKASEDFRTVPNDSAPFGDVRKDAEAFGNVPKSAEPRTGRSQHHVLTVTETAKRFEEAGVARTERSITNWCQPNAHGVARLDCFLDQNERKYFITPQSVDLAIKEEQAKAERNQPGTSEDFGRRPAQVGSDTSDDGDEADAGSATAKALQAKVNRLKIEVAVKDQLIERYDADRSEVLERIESAGRYTGRLEARVLEVDGPDKLLELSSGSEKASHPESGESPVDENGGGRMAA